MTDERNREACGRCSMTTVVAMVDDEDDEGGERRGKNPFDGDRIELEEADLRRAVPHEVFAGGIRERLDAVAERIVYGDRTSERESEERDGLL